MIKYLNWRGLWIYKWFDTTQRWLNVNSIMFEGFGPSKFCLLPAVISAVYSDEPKFLNNIGLQPCWPIADQYFTTPANQWPGTDQYKYQYWPPRIGIATLVNILYILMKIKTIFFSKYQRFMVTASTLIKCNCHGPYEHVTIIRTICTE